MKNFWRISKCSNQLPLNIKLVENCPGFTGTSNFLLFSAVNVIVASGIRNVKFSLSLRHRETTFTRDQVRLPCILPSNLLMYFKPACVRSRRPPGATLRLLLHQSSNCLPIAVRRGIPQYKFPLLILRSRFGHLPFPFHRLTTRSNRGTSL